MEASCGGLASSTSVPEDSRALREADRKLFVALSLEDVALAREALDEGATLEGRDKDCSPLMVAATSGCDVIVNLLLDRGAWIDAQDSFQRTPLYVASKMQNFSTMTILLDRGARADIRDFKGNTPLFHKSALIKLHLLKLKTAGLPVDESLNPKDFFMGRSVEAALLKELKRIKDVEVVGGLSLYDTCLGHKALTLLKGNHGLSRVLENMLNSSELKLKSQFPYYFNILKNAFGATVLRISLEEQVSELSVWNVDNPLITDVRLPDLVVRKILKYLTSEDLKNMVQSST